MPFDYNPDPLKRKDNAAVIAGYLTAVIDHLLGRCLGSEACRATASERNSRFVAVTPFRNAQGLRLKTLQRKALL
jgi:hypothetical protein